jgi:3-hydroxybutyryl-CoA dehydrogenase
MIREAVNIVAEGIASVEDVDLAVRNSFGLRLPAYGIFEHQDLVGLPLAQQVVDYVAHDLYNEPRAPDLYQVMLESGYEGAAVGRGFYDWSKKDAIEVRARRDRFIALVLKSGLNL